MCMRSTALPAAGLLLVVVLLSSQVAVYSQATPKAKPAVPQAAKAPKVPTPAPKAGAEVAAAPAAPTKPPAKKPEPVCGADPPPLAEISPSITSCWADAALPSAALNYAPIRMQDPQRAAATSWSELQRLVASADGPILITITGSLTANSPLIISNKAKGVHIAGPAEIACSADAGTAVSVQRSSGVVLEDITISGCSDSAVIINTTSAAKVAVPITTAVPGRSRTTPAPDALLKGVTLKGNTGLKGAGLRALWSRVVLQACSLSSNIADGCGGAVFADRSALLLLDTKIAENVGNNTEASEDCKGGALHTQDSWVAVARSTFTQNRGVNGSAVLLVRPVGVAQLQDCSFDSNQERPGVSEEFASSSGSVAVIGTGAYEVALERGVEAECEPVTEGLAVARCTFSNNTAARSAGRGGAIAGNGAFIGVINTTFIGTPANLTQAVADSTGSDATAAGAVANLVGVKQFGSIPPNSFLGGCIATEGSNLFVTGSSFSHCNAHYLGGAISARGVESLVQDSVFDNCYSDTGGAIRIVNGGHKFINLTITNCRAANGGAGINLESNDFLDIHMEALNLQHNVMTGKGAGIRTEVAANTDPGYTFTLSLHDSTITNNIAGEGAGLYIGGTVIAYLKNNTIAHNTALIHGGGMKVFNTPGSKYTFTTVGNTFLNNSAVVRGGGLITHPCNISMHGDKVLGNRAGQDGGGLMVYGGDKVILYGAEVSCNSAQNGGGIAVRKSDFGVASTLTVKCSNVTANGGAADATAQGRCLQVLSKPSSEKRLSDTETLLAASAVSSTAAVAATSTEKGGGLYVASGQEAVVVGSSISANLASRSGAGVFVDSGGYFELNGDAEAGPALISYNNCTSGSGGGVYLNQETEMSALDATLSNNQGMFGGGLFAMSNATTVDLEAVIMNNNTAAAGGAVATLGGTQITCTGCSFTSNKAKVGGALMLQGGECKFTECEMTSNMAAAVVGGAATAVPPESIPFIVGQVQTSAGGAAYVAQGALKLSQCKIDGNVAWGRTGRGGGVFVDDASLQLVNTSVTNNWASMNGGGVLLGPAGESSMQATGGSFTGNSAQRYGGAVAAGVLLPSETAAASKCRWNLTFKATKFIDNTAGQQGGAVACSVCDSLSFSSATFQRNIAGQTGGGVSCVSCSKYLTDGCTFDSNVASSGGGACILAAGKGSSSSNSDFLGNLANSKALAAARARLQDAFAVAQAIASPAVVGPSASMLAASARAGGLPSPQNVLPACGVAGTGGGLCLGLWDAGFQLVESGSFVNNTGLFGAGLFVEACPEGPELCPVSLNPASTVFKNNTMPTGRLDSYRRHLLQAQRAATAAVGADVAGAGVDMYVTNATVLLPVVGGAMAAAPRAAANVSVQAAPAKAVPVQAVPTSAKVGKPAAAAAAGTTATVGGRRHILQQKQRDSLAFVNQLAASGRKASGAGAAAGSIVPRIATGPAKLGDLLVAGRNTSKGSVSEAGRLQAVQLSVLDQLDGLVASDVAEQLLVQAKADFGNCSTCELSGMSKVLPVKGIASFDQLEIKAKPGSNQTITFTLVSPVDGSELGGQQAVTVRLPTCHWGQATMEAGCYSCSYPLFTFSPNATRCSICPANANECNATTLLPETGYWNSNPLSTYMHKCPRRDACRRTPEVIETMRCLQQQQLIVNNPGYVNDGPLGDRMSGSSTHPASPWQALRTKCLPVLQQLAANTSTDSMNHMTLGGKRGLLQSASAEALMLNPYLNNSEAISAHYDSLLCTPGYAGRLCSSCEFPGQKYGAFGTTISGACAKCPEWAWSVASYVLSRVFDIILLGLLVITTLVEMKKRRAAVQAARHSAMLKQSAALTAGTATSAPASAVAVDTGDNTSFNSAAASHLSETVGGSSARKGSARQGSARQESGVRSGVIRESAVSDDVPGAGSRTDQYDDVAGSRQSSRAGGATLGHLESFSSMQKQQVHQASDAAAAADQPQRMSSKGRIIESAAAAAVAQPPAASGNSGNVVVPMEGVGGRPLPAAAATASGAAGGAAAAVSGQGPYKNGWRRVPLFARELSQKQGGPSAATKQTTRGLPGYTPSTLTMGELFEVLKDFLQVLSILQIVLVSWQTAASTYFAALAGVSVTPLSTKAWISLDCLLPRTLEVAQRLQIYQIAAQLLLPLAYTALILVAFMIYAVNFSSKNRMKLVRDVIMLRLKAPIISTLLVVLSFFYPAMAYAVLGTFSCRYLDPTDVARTVDGEVLSAPGWYWTLDLDMQCFVDPLHRALAFGLGIPGTILLLAYPIVQCIVLGRAAGSGGLQPTSDFFANYGHLVQDFRPRLAPYWASIVELRKLVLVAVVLVLASTGVVSQLLGCSLVLLTFWAATMGLLPYPYRLLNRLHLGTNGVLVAVVWINLFVAAAEERDGGVLASGIAGRRSLALQLLTVLLVVVMVAVLLVLLVMRLYRQAIELLDMDKDGRISGADIKAFIAKLQGNSGVLSAACSCMGGARKATKARQAAPASPAGSSSTP